MPTACLPGLPGIDADCPPRPLVRARIGAAYADLTRRVGRGLRLPLADGVTLHVAFAAEALADGEDALALDGPHGRLTLQAGVPFLLALTGIDVAAFDAAPAPQREWLEARVLGRLAGSPLAPMTRLSRRAPAAVESAPATLHLSLQDGSHAVGTLAQGEAATWLALLATQPAQPVRLPQSAFLSLAETLDARNARHALAPGILRT
jgi:type III secretion protein Q